MGTGDGIDSSLLRSLTGLQDTASLAGFLQIAFDAVVTFDSRERILSWNPAAERMFGWSLEEALGKTPAELFWPAEMPLEQESKTQRQARINRGETLQGRLTPCRKDGSTFPAQYAARAIFDPSGRISGYLAVYRDLSAQAQALEKEKQLQESNHRLNQILASIQDDFYVLNRDWVFVFASRTFTARIGKEPEDFVGNNIWEMFPKHIGGVLYQNFHASMEERQIRRFEMPGKYTDTWYRMTAFPSDEGITVIGTDITERKLAEEALRESEERYRHLVKHAPSGIYEIDIETTRFTEVNDTMCEILGYTREELLSIKPEELLEEESRGLFKERILKTLAGERISEQTEYKVRTRDGHELWAVLNTTINYEHGRPKSVSVIAHDITERKQVETTLRESEERYRRIVEDTHEGIWMIDSNGATTYVNPQMAALLGYTPEEMIGRNAFDFVIDDDISRGQQEWQNRQKDNGGRQSEYRYRHKDGHAVWCLVNSSTLVDGQGRNMGILGMFTDITGRKRSEELLVQQAQLLDLSSEAIFVWELGGVIEYWNYGAEKLYGYSNQDAIGRNSHELLATMHPQGVTAFLRTLEQEGEWRGEVIHRTKDGRTVIVESSQQLVNQGGRRLVLETNRDVTERKRAEDALRQSEHQLQLLNESLEQKVQEKTAEVRRLASDLTKAVQRERHRISHILHDDLQQRIYAIQMQLTILRYELQKESTAAQNETSDIEQQLSEVLEITRHLSIDLSPPILQNEGLSHAISWLAGRMRQRYGLPIELQADEAFVIADEDVHVFLFNCVRELLFNIVKHSEASRALVALAWTEGGLQIEVSDNGKGFVASNNEGQENAGTAEQDIQQLSFGLPTIRKQLSLFGGRMEIKTNPGAGTRILLFIPVDEKDKVFPSGI